MTKMQTFPPFMEENKMLKFMIFAVMVNTITISIHKYNNIVCMYQNNNTASSFKRL